MFLEISFSIVDIILLVIFGILGLLGLKKGFLKQVGKIVSLVLAIALCYFFFKKVAAFLMDLDIVSTWQANLQAWLEGLGDGEIFKANLKTAGTEGLHDALVSAKIPEFIANGLINKLNLEELPDMSIAEFLAPVLIQYGCYAAAFLGIFLVSFIVISIIVKLLQKLIHVVPLGGVIDRLLGLALSVFKFVIIIWLIFYAMTLLTAFPKISEFVLNFVNDNIIEKSTIAKYLYENNLLLQLINGTIDIDLSFIGL